MSDEYIATVEEQLRQQRTLLQHNLTLCSCHLLQTALESLKLFERVNKPVLEAGRLRALQTAYGIINNLEHSILKEGL